MDQKTGKSPEKERLTARDSPLHSVLWVFFAVVLIAGPVQAETPRHPASHAPSKIRLSEPVTVQRVIDGDTVELASGVHVRYIGIDTPEVRRRVGDRWVTVDEPYGREAYEFNRSLVEGRPVRLEKDVESTDRYGRVLAYVYVADPATGNWIQANAELLRAGLARLMTIAPNRRYEKRFGVLEEEARIRGAGMWKNGAGEEKGSPPPIRSKEEIH
jgi:micrococcal nuclease